MSDENRREDENWDEDDGRNETDQEFFAELEEEIMGKSKEVEKEIIEFLRSKIPKNVTTATDPKRFKAMVEIIKLIKEDVEKDSVKAEYKLTPDVFFGLDYYLEIHFKEEVLFLDGDVFPAIVELSKPDKGDVSQENLIGGVEFARTTDNKLSVIVTFRNINIPIATS